jgi:hypothetical protein
MTGEGAASFQRRLTDRLRWQFRVATGVNRLFEHPILFGPAVSLASVFPGLITWITQSTRLKGFDDVIEG